MKIFKRVMTIVAIVAAVLVAGYLYVDNMDVIGRSIVKADDFIRDCVKGNYEQVARNPESYQNKRMYISGTVIQVIDNGNKIQMRVQDKDGNIWYIFYTYEKNQTRILEGDALTIYGLCCGTVSYEAITKQKITIPGINGYFIR